MNIILSPKYLSFSQSKSFNEFCQPLFFDTDIGSVVYFRTYRDGGYFHLTTNPHINKHMYLESMGKRVADYKLVDALFAKNRFFNNKMCVFIEDISGLDYWGPIYEEFNIKSTINIVEKFDDYYDGFWFVTRPEKSSYSFFINHPEVLENFIMYFRERARDLILEGERNKIVWFNNHPDYCKVVNDLKGDAIKDIGHIDSLKNHLKLKKYPIINGGIKVYISLSEIKCLQYLGQGFSHKDIGDVLNVSHRTIESHLQNIKNRLGGCSQNQLLKIYHANSLLHVV